MKIASLFCLVVLIAAASAQHKCDYEEKMQNHYDANPGAKQAIMATREMIQNKIAEAKLASNNTREIKAILTIPVVWHILYDTAPASLVTQAQIDQEMIWLNDWYSTQNVNYGTASAMFFNDIAVSSDIEIQFVLTKIDPNGNSHPGVEYRQTPVASTCGDSEIFLTSQGGLDIWDSLQYMNIYTCDISALGYAYLPSPQSHFQDGMVLQYDQLGDSFFSGSTISHEMGHWLGLPHTFEGCGVGDGIADTPPTDEPATDYVDPNAACPGMGGAVDGDFQKCSGIVMVQNNMDYNYEPCLAYFSKGQAATMRGYLTGVTTRGGLSTSMGLNSPCPTFDCTGKVCGDNGCGGTCGDCSLNFGNTICDPNGSCTSCPTFSCPSGLGTCGDNGCGGICGTCGTGQVCMPTQYCESPNEVCSTASTVSVTSSSVQYEGSNFGSDIADSTCATATTHPIWYTFTSSVDGMVTADTSGSSLDTTLSILGGSCGALTCIDFNDDISYYTGDLTSSVTFPVTQGSTYYLVVGGFDTETGEFKLNVILNSFVPSNPPVPTNSASVSRSGNAIPSTTGSSSSSATRSSTAAPSQSNAPGTNSASRSKSINGVTNTATRSNTAAPSQSNAPGTNSASRSNTAVPSSSNAPVSTNTASRSRSVNVPSQSNTPVVSNTPSKSKNMPSASNLPGSQSTSNVFTTLFSSFFTFSNTFSATFSGFSSFTSFFSSSSNSSSSSSSGASALAASILGFFGVLMMC